MIDPLCVATRGILSNDPLAVATRGYICAVIAVVLTPGGYVMPRTVVLQSPDLDAIPLDRLLREDEELLAIIVSAVSEGLLP